MTYHFHSPPFFIYIVVAHSIVVNNRYRHRTPIASRSFSSLSRSIPRSKSRITSITLHRLKVACVASNRRAEMPLHVVTRHAANVLHMFEGETGEILSTSINVLYLYSLDAPQEYHVMPQHLTCRMVL